MEGLLLSISCGLAAIIFGLCGYIWRQHAKQEAGILEDLKGAIVKLNSTMELIRVEFTRDIKQLDNRVTAVEIKYDKCNKY